MARRAIYDADFAVVYGAALDVTSGLYPQLAEDPTKGRISTAWHEVRYSNNTDDPRAQQIQSSAVADPTQSNASSQQPLGSVAQSFKRYFIRFDVTVAGGRPWRIRVVGHASEWEPGNAIPSELRGPATPHWLPGRTEALTVAIYKRLKQYAIVVPEENTAPPDAAVAIDLGAFGAIPPPAAQRLGELRQVITKRDYEALRPLLAVDVTWSLGSAPGVDGALAMWQADPTILEGMAAAIDAGCRGDDHQVVCPPAAAETPGYTGWRLALEARDGAWVVTTFVQGD